MQQLKANITLIPIKDIVEEKIIESTCQEIPCSSSTSRSSPSLDDLKNSSELINFNEESSNLGPRLPKICKRTENQTRSLPLEGQSSSTISRPQKLPQVAGKLSIKSLDPQRSVQSFHRIIPNPSSPSPIPLPESTPSSSNSLQRIPPSPKSSTTTLPTKSTSTTSKSSVDLASNKENCSEQNSNSQSDSIATKKSSNLVGASISTRIVSSPSSPTSQLGSRIKVTKVNSASQMMSRPTAKSFFSFKF